MWIGVGDLEKLHKDFGSGPALEHCGGDLIRFGVC
jgi:hypothetical protein